MSSHFRFTTEGYVYSDYVARCPEYINNDWKFANGNKGWENAGRQFNFYCRPSKKSYHINTRNLSTLAETMKSADTLVH